MNRSVFGLVLAVLAGVMLLAGRSVFAQPETPAAPVDSLGSEPNDTFATAIVVQPLETVQGTWDYPCDIDMYKFNGRAGDIFTEFWTDNTIAYRVFDANGNEMFGPAVVLPTDGTYYLEMPGYVYIDGSEQVCIEQDYTVTIGVPLWVSATQNGLPTVNGGTAIKSSDIATRANAAGKWQLVFDGSDVGITTNIDALERLEADGSILISLAAAQNVPGLGNVKPQDIIKFVPTSLGENTAGSFEWYLDGSDVGLTTAGENIDAIQFKPDPDDANPLVISVTGSGSAPRQSGGSLGFADEDLITFVGTSYGENSAGAWRFNLDGSTVTGMKAEDVSAATFISVTPSRLSPLLLAFNSAFKINGVKGQPSDIFNLDNGVLVKKIATKTVDGITVGVKVGP